MINQYRELTKELIAVIRTKREAARYSQEYMANKLGIAQSTYSALENGEGTLCIKKLAAICTILNIETLEIQMNVPTQIQLRIIPKLSAEE